MSELKTLSNGQVVTLLDGDELGDAGDVLMRVGADGAAYRPVSDVAAAWGGITGTLSAQTDLQSALDAKAAASTAILHQATVELTDAQIKALPTTGVQIVAAPGENKLIRPTYVAMLLNNTAGAYTNASANAALIFDVGTQTALFFDENYNAALTGSDSVVLALTPLQYVEAAQVIGNLEGLLVNMVNGALKIAGINTAGNWTGGNAANTLRVSVTYYILNTLTGVFE